MTSIPLFFDSRKGQKISENFATSFNPSLQLNIKKSYEMALISSQIWYSWHNTTSLNNNFYYSTGESGSKFFEIPPGSYNTEDLNDEIKYLIREKGDDENSITLTPNYNKLKSRIELKNYYYIDFRPPHTLNSVLGFDSSYLVGNKIHDSKNIVNITNINSLQIHCSLIEGGYINGVSSNLLFTVSPNVPPGYLINKKFMF